MSFADFASVILAETWISAIVTTIIGFIAAYYSFALSRALVNRGYRNTAIWTALIAIALVATVYPLLFFALSNFAPSSFFQLVVLYAVSTADLIILYAWLDSTIRIAIDQDFFHRDTFGWSHLRYIFWAGLILLDLSVWMGLLIPTNYPFFVARGLAFAGFFGVVGLVLFVSGLRTSDRTIRTYLMWLGLIMLWALVMAVLGTLAPFAFPSAWVVMGYLLFRAARSLSPISKLQAGDTKFTRGNVSPSVST